MHKTPGATLPLASIEIGDIEKQLGLLFVAISRVRRLDDLCLLRPLSGDRLLKMIHHSALPQRKQFDARLAALEAPLDALIATVLGDRTSLSEWFRHEFRQMML